MRLTLDSDQRMLRDTAAEYFGQRCRPDQLRQLRDSDDSLGYDPVLWKEMAELGYAGLLVPESCGGSDLGLLAAAQVAEQIGRRIVPCPFLSSAALAVLALRHGEGEKRYADLLSAIANGDRIVAFAIDEAARHDPQQITTHMENGRLHGYKRMVIDAHCADELLVAADLGAGIGLIRIDPTAPGVDVQRSKIPDAHNLGSIRFTGAKVEDDAVIREPEALRAALLGGRALVSATQLGAARQVFTLTVDYLQQRKQFGRLIGSYQGLQHRAAHLYSELEAATSASLAALSALDAGEDDAALFVIMAKIKVIQTATLAANEAVQMHGGVGMTDELDIGLYMKRIRSLSILLGDRPWLLNQVADLQDY